MFTNAEKRKVLNGIVHPAVRKAMVWEVVKYWMQDEKWCVVDVPLLVEGGLWRWVGLVVVVFWYAFGISLSFTSYLTFF